MEGATPVHRFPTPFSARPLGSRRSRRTVAVLTSLALAAGLAGFTGANAATTIPSPTNESGANGSVVRGDVATVNVDPGGVNYFRSSGSGTFSALGSPGLCWGTGSPSSEVKVTGPDNVVVLQKTSPVKNLANQIVSPQPASPSGTQHRGGAWSAEVQLSVPGVYRVDTTLNNRVKTGVFGGCGVGTGNGTSVGASPVFEPPTFFEYRPWQQKFTDLLGTGKVQLNTVPKEFQFEVSGASAPSPIIDGAQAMRLYSLPNGAAFSLDIPNPGACGSDPLSCLPETALSCNPAQGCVPRLVTINYQGAADKLTGLFDLETKAFAAVATTGGHTRVLVSGGTQVDKFLHDLLGQVTDAAGQLGIDLPALLDTDVDLNVQQPDGTTKVIRVNLLKGLEMFSVANGPATGLGIAAPITLGAGVITHFSTWTGSPDPDYTDSNGLPHSSFGYDVTEASALPAVPSLPSLASLLVPPGKIQHIRSRIPKGAGTHSVVLGADTHADPATGLPVHLPLISTPGTTTDDGIDFVGRATVVQFDICVDLFGTLVCGGGGLVLGTGVATFGTNPLPINFGSIPLIWGDELGLGSLMAPVDGLVSDLTESVLTNPAVTDLLGQVTALLPSLPGLPTTPGGGTPGGIPGLPGLPGLGGLPSGGLLGLPLGNLPLNSLLGNLPLANLLQIF
jgi:hypothetical protein